MQISQLLQAIISRLIGLTYWMTWSGTFWFWIVMMLLGSIPVTYAMPTGKSPFPDVPFKSFSQFILQHFGSKISLSTALVILFSLTENPDLLNLHARQQYAKCKGENRTAASGWMNSLARALKKSITENQGQPLKMKLVDKDMDEEQETKALSLKLDGLSRILTLHPYSDDGEFQGKLQPVSHQLIEPVHVICPNSMECDTKRCKGRSLLQTTATRDVPQVTLIKDNRIYDNVSVLTGQCSKCKTKYFADHVRSVENSKERHYSNLYLNSAKYVKVGQSIWVDRLFGTGVLNAMYSFHASAAAYTEYWNNSIWRHQEVEAKRITRRQVWQAFVQESICIVATTIGEDLLLQANLAIDEVTKQAFEILGEKGCIRVAVNHECSECAQEYKDKSDITTNFHPAATVGVDDSDMPNLQGPDIGRNLAISGNEDTITAPATTEAALVTMAVIDGIVMGPPVCATYCFMKQLLTSHLALCI